MYIQVHIYVYIYVCTYNVCVSVCVFVSVCVCLCTYIECVLCVAHRMHLACESVSHSQSHTHRLTTTHSNACRVAHRMHLLPRVFV